MVMVAHDLLAIAEVCNRVIWMEHGRVRAQGEPKEIVTQYIAACVKNPSPELGLALNGLEGVRGAPLPPLPEPGKAA
jgi:energy-coupling factor transporter ATP-binding protein EcfA2